MRSVLSSSILHFVGKQVTCSLTILLCFLPMSAEERNRVVKSPPESAAERWGSGQFAMVDVVTGPGRSVAAAFQVTFFFLNRQKQSKHGKYIEMEE